MRVITLNVNGIRSAERKGFARWLARVEPWDVVCLQEIKAHHDDVPRVAARAAQVARDFHPGAAQGLQRRRRLRAGAAARSSTGFGSREFDARGPLSARPISAT